MPGNSIPAVELRELTKRFGAVMANAGVNLRVAPGTIHGLIGENGAGKSTAMKLLYGMYRPDSGDIVVFGEKRVWSSPLDAIRCGLGMVHQHFMLAGTYSALDNILLGAEPMRLGIVQRRRAQERLDALGAQYGLTVEWRRPIAQLAVGQQQRIEILKLLYREARILVLDEPTAVLTPQETKALFDNLRRLRDEGKTILLVTHKLKEVMALTERVTVFRAGRVTGEVRTADTTTEELAFLMVGRKVSLGLATAADGEGSERRKREKGGASDPMLALEISKLTVKGKSEIRHRLSDVSFSVGRGEVVGIAGVEGNGQNELLQAILNPRDAHCRSSGTVKVLGREVQNWKADRIRDCGVAVIPEDRLREGLLLERPVVENFLLGRQRSPAFNRSGLLNFGAIRNSAARAMEEYDVRPRELDTPAGRLSGGNQQKLIVAREFERKPKVLIAAHPNRGVDVGAVESIHARILRARDDGAGVLLVSSELDEVLALSDRILVMYEGRIVAQFGRGKVAERELGMKMGGM